MEEVILMYLFMEAAFSMMVDCKALKYFVPSFFLNAFAVSCGRALLELCYTASTISSGTASFHPYPKAFRKQHEPVRANSCRDVNEVDLGSAGTEGWCQKMPQEVNICFQVDLTS